jgi:hypothetical protein
METHRAPRDVHAALQEEERGQEGGGDDPEVLELRRVLVEHLRHGEPKQEGRQHGVALCKLP